MQRTLIPIVALVLLAAPTTGCLGFGGEEDASEPADATESSFEANETPKEETEVEEPVDTGPNVTVEWFNGTAQGQAVPPFGPTCFSPACENFFEFEVSNGTTAVVAELAWERDVQLMLDVDIPFEKCEPGYMEDCPPESTSGESPLAIQVTRGTDIPSGNWTASVYAEDSPAQGTEFTMAVSLFEDGQVPQGYAKLAGDEAAP